MKKVLIFSFYWAAILMGSLLFGKVVIDLNDVTRAVDDAYPKFFFVGLDARNVDKTGKSYAREAAEALKGVERLLKVVLNKKTSDKKNLSTMVKAVQELLLLVRQIEKRSVPTKEKKITDEMVIKSIKNITSSYLQTSEAEDAGITEFKQSLKDLCEALLMSTEHQVLKGANKIDRVVQLCTLIDESIEKKNAKSLRNAITFVNLLPGEIGMQESWTDTATSQRLHLLLMGLKKILAFWAVEMALKEKKKSFVIHDGIAEALTAIPYEKLTFDDIPSASSNSLFFQLIEKKIPQWCVTAWKELAQEMKFDTSHMAGLQKQIKG